MAFPPRQFGPELMVTEKNFCEYPRLIDPTEAHDFPRIPVALCRGRWLSICNRWIGTEHAKYILR